MVNNRTETRIKPTINQKQCIEDTSGNAPEQNEKTHDKPVRRTLSGIETRPQITILLDLFL